MSLLHKDFETWKFLIGKHFGKKVAKRSQSLMVDIIAVAMAIKSAYLYDVGEPCATKILIFLQDLIATRLICTHLNVVEIGMDCVIVNVDVVKSRNKINEFLSGRLINVSGVVKAPCMYDGCSAVQELEAVCSTIAGNLDGSQVVSCKLPSSVTCNISTLFGFLLNYPLLYWYDTTAEDCPNCLSMEKLKCVRVIVTYQCIESLNPALNHKAHAESNKTYEHCLYSFSYPACLDERVKHLVQDWFRDVQEKVEQCQLFFDANIHVEEKTLEAVTL